jgi:hypothetical protein
MMKDRQTYFGGPANVRPTPGAQSSTLKSTASSSHSRSANNGDYGRAVLLSSNQFHFAEEPSYVSSRRSGRVDVEQKPLVSLDVNLDVSFNDLAHDGAF